MSREVFYGRDEEIDRQISRIQMEDRRLRHGVPKAIRIVDMMDLPSVDESLMRVLAKKHKLFGLDDLIPVVAKRNYGPCAQCSKTTRWELCAKCEQANVLKYTGHEDSKPVSFTVTLNCERGQWSAVIQDDDREDNHGGTGRFPNRQKLIASVDKFFEPIASRFTAMHEAMEKLPPEDRRWG